jgi:hypothetical protein
MNLLSLLSQRILARTVSRKACSAFYLSSSSFRILSPNHNQADRASHHRKNFSTDKVPEEDYYDGHLIVDHLEYLDDMIDKCLAIETSMDELKDTNAQKRRAYKEASSDEVNALFEKSASQKENISSQLANLKAIMKSAQQNAFAVDGPDGTTDAQEREGLQEVSKIIDYAATHEDVQKMNKKHEFQEGVKKERARDPEHDW